MLADIRAYTSCNLGRIVSGNIADSYISGGIGLVKTRGTLVIQDTVVPRPGTAVTVDAVRPSGQTYRVPRFLRVISSQIIPADRTTQVEVGCRLTYFQDMAEPQELTADDDFENADVAEADKSIVTTTISAASVFIQCCAAIGVNPSSVPLFSKFTLERFDMSPGYVQIMSDLLASECKLGYLIGDDSLAVVSASMYATGSLISLSERQLIAVNPLGIGQPPADKVFVNYSTLKLKSTPGEDLTEDEATGGSEGSGSDNFSRSVTSGLSYAVVPYTDANGDQQFKTFEVRDYTRETSEYDTLNGKNLLVKRTRREEKSSVAVAGAVVTDYLSAGATWGSGRASSDTVERFSYNRDGQEVRRVMTRTGDRIYGMGSLGLPMELDGTLVSIPQGQMELERIVTKTIRSGQFQKTITERYGPWVQTPQGQQTIAEARETFTTAAQVTAFMNEVLDGSYLLDVTTATQKVGETEEQAPSESLGNLDAVANDDGDPDAGWTVESTVDGTYAVGTGSDPFGSYTFAPPTAGLTAGQISKLNSTASLLRPPARRLVLEMPYNDNDRIIKVGSAYRVITGTAEAQARKYGRVYNDLLLGARYGLALQLPVWKAPRYPFAAFSLRLGSNSAVFRANGVSWTINNDGIVSSIDALYVGGVGGTAFSFPVANGVTPPTVLPAESTTEPDVVLGTVADVGGDPQATLNAAFPSASTNEGVQDLNTLSYWVYDGATWNDVGTDPGATATVDTLPVVEETDGWRLRTRHRLAVAEFDYALSLPVVTVELVSRHVLTGRAVVLVNLPAAGISVAGLAPAIGVAEFRAPAVGVAVAALAPVVAAGGGATVPSVDIAVASVAPRIAGPVNLAAPSAGITVAAVAPVTVGVELWTPTQLTTALWLDAADTSTITDTGGLVDQINDKSGNSRNFTGTTTTRPTTNASTLNGKNVLDFAGDYLTSASAASTWNLLHDSTGSSIFIVAKAGTSSNPDETYVAIATNGTSSLSTGACVFYDDRSFVPRSNALVALVTLSSLGNYAVQNVAGDVWTPNAYQVLGVVSDPANGTAASRQSARFNGGSSIANNASTSTPSSSDATYTLQIGAGGDNSSPWTGGIAEVVIISGLISDTNREKMEGYLAWKWGLQANLPGGHPYASAAPTV